VLAATLDPASPRFNRRIETIDLSNNMLSAECIDVLVQAIFNQPLIHPYQARTADDSKGESCKVEFRFIGETHGRSAPRVASTVLSSPVQHVVLLFCSLHEIKPSDFLFWHGNTQLDVPDLHSLFARTSFSERERGETVT